MRPRFLSLLLVLFLISCGEKEKTAVSFMVFGDPAERIAYQELVDAYHAAHPDTLPVEMTHIPSPRDYRTRLVTEFAAGNPPDITLMNYRRYASFAAQNLLEPLGSYLNDSSIIQADDFYPVALEGFVWQGELMCIPQNISSLVVYYNKDLFDAAGLPYPSDKWTWDEFVQTAVSLTKDNNGDGRTDQYGLGIDPSLYRLAPFIWQNEALLVDDLAHPTRLTLTRPPTLEALQWFVDLRQVHAVAPDRVEEQAQDSESRFVGGTTAMFLNSRRGTPTYRSISSFGWDVAPLPDGKTSASVLHSDAYCMSAAATDKTAVWQFIEFANSVAGQTIIAGSGRTVPSLMEVAQSPAFHTPDKPPSRSYVFTDNAPIFQLVPVISTWQEIESTAGEEIERAFYGEITAEEAARLTVQRTEEYFLLGDTAK